MFKPFKSLTATLAMGAAIILGACGDKAPVDNGAEASKAQKPDTQAAEANPAIWLVEDEDTQVYLFGTVHVMRRGVDWKTDKIKSILDTTDAVYFETDIEALETLDFQKQVMELAMYQDGSTLMERLTEEQKTKVIAAAKENNLPVEVVERMEPWMAAMTLTSLEVTRSGYLPTEGVENGIMKMTEAQNMPYRQFETPVEQLGFLDNLPEDDQIDFLMSTIDAGEEGQEMLENIIDSWFVGDVDAMADIMSDDEAWGSEGVRDAILTQRNANWVATIDKLLDDEAGTFFVAVGAAHLAGEDSVITMLEDRGETVVRQ